MKVMQEQFYTPPAFKMPYSVPERLPRNKYEIGMYVRWAEVPEPDFGQVIGLLYTYEASCQTTGLHYLILLDKKSPSYSICIHDFAFEDDIELVSTGNGHD